MENRKPRNEYEGGGSRCGARKPGSQGWRGIQLDAKEIEGIGGDGEKRKVRKTRRAGGYLCFGKAARAAPTARCPIEGTPNPAGPTPTTK